LWRYTHWYTFKNNNKCTSVYMASIIIYNIMMHHYTYTIHFFFFLGFVSLLFHVPLLLRKLGDCCSIRSTEFIKIVCTVFTKPDILNRISHVQKRYIAYIFKKYFTNAFIPPTYYSRHILCCVMLVYCD